MKKLFHFDSTREQYQCDAAIVWCYDNRFDLAFQKFLHKIGIQYSDPIKIAGGAKSLASPERESDREFVLEQIRLSMKLHGTRRVILMLHSDCGAYGGLQKGFGGDENAEFVNHRSELIKATKALRDVFPDMEVNSFFVNFEGVWEPYAVASADL